MALIELSHKAGPKIHLKFRRPIPRKDLVTDSDDQLSHMIISSNLSHIFYHLIWQNWQSARDGKASKGFDFVPQALLTCQNLASVRIAWEKEKRISRLKCASLAAFSRLQVKVCSGWLPTLKQMFKLFLLLSCQLWPDCKSASKMMIKSLASLWQGGGVWQKSAQLWWICRALSC